LNLTGVVNWCVCDSLLSGYDSNM